MDTFEILHHVRFRDIWELVLRRCCHRGCSRMLHWVFASVHMNSVLCKQHVSLADAECYSLCREPDKVVVFGRSHSHSAYNCIRYFSRVRLTRWCGEFEGHSAVMG